MNLTIIGQGLSMSHHPTRWLWSMLQAWTSTPIFWLTSPTILSVSSDSSSFIPKILTLPSLVLLKVVKVTFQFFNVFIFLLDRALKFLDDSCVCFYSGLKFCYDDVSYCFLYRVSKNFQTLLILQHVFDNVLTVSSSSLLFILGAIFTGIYKNLY